MCSQLWARENGTKRGKIDASLDWIGFSCFNGLGDSDLTNSVADAVSPKRSLVKKAEDFICHQKNRRGNF